jgi:hypothetical protein
MIAGISLELIGIRAKNLSNNSTIQILGRLQPVIAPASDREFLPFPGKVATFALFLLL